jgi:hypothetical protein
VFQIWFSGQGRRPSSSTDASGMDMSARSGECPSHDWTIGSRKYSEIESATRPIYDDYAEWAGSVLFYGSVNFGGTMLLPTESGVSLMSNQNDK